MKVKNQQERWDIPEFNKVPSVVHQSILSTLQDIEKLNEKPTHVKQLYSKKIKIRMLAVAVMIIGATSACAVNLYKQRMESINQERLKDYYIQVQTSHSEANHYSRSLTEEEKERYEALEKGYETEGKFPKGELTVLDDLNYKGEGIGFYPDRGVLFLPDSELTDEEMLQIIDFCHKVDYSLQKVNKEIEQGKIEDPLQEVKNNEETVEVSDLSELRTSDLTSVNQTLV